MKITRLLLLCFFLSNWACNKDSSGEQVDFDRAVMLENYATHLIRPAYQNLLEEVQVLQDHWTDFKAVATEANLSALRDQWLQVALAWEGANAFNFGPAGEGGLRKGLVEEIGTFPVNMEKIEGFIATGDTSLNNSDRDSRGILAIEYLLYGSSGDTQDVLLALQDDHRRAYLTAILQHLYTEVATVVDAWATYQNEFITNAGTDVGSSTSQLYNEFVRSYEAAKNFKVALPAGKRAGQSQPEPQLVEAYYSGRSLELLQAHLAAIERIYHGKDASGVDRSGFYEYLQAVVGGPELVTAEESQWSQVLRTLSAIPTNTAFSELIAQDDPHIIDLYTELQKQVRFFKSDMSSLLGIAITFNSGDGD